jgi:hypothetical protein
MNMGRTVFISWLKLITMQAILIKIAFRDKIIPDYCKSGAKQYCLTKCILLGNEKKLIISKRVYCECFVAQN